MYNKTHTDDVKKILSNLKIGHVPWNKGKSGIYSDETIAKFKKPGAKVITVTGAGGDRDRTKRPLMAQVSARLSDQLILTSDNPRTEAPDQILSEMEAGLDPAGHIKTLTIEKREQAIKTAVRLAQTGDIILVAGKGHEKYQEIMGVKHPFDDKAVLGKCLSEL